MPYPTEDQGFQAVTRQVHVEAICRLLVNCGHIDDNSITNRLDMHLSDHCSECDRLRFVRPRATPQRIVRIVRFTSRQLKPREIQVTTITAIPIQKL